MGKRLEFATTMVPDPEKHFLRALSHSLKRIDLRKNTTIIVALSGGSDSVALFHSMLALRGRFGYRVVAAHLNHGIRGAESDRDEAFVRELCARFEVDLVVERAGDLSTDTPNLEERAREARHAFLNATADRIGAEYIAVAHQADDQAETVLMRLLRGAGAAGLAAIAERGPGRIIRPMIAVTREEVTAYLKSIGEKFVNDSSNQSSTYLRNRVRTELMPTLEANYAPGLRGRLVQLASEMRALDDFVSTAAKRELESNASSRGLDISRFAQLHPALQAEVIRQFIKSETGSLRRIERVHIDAVRRLCLEGPANGSVDIAGVRMVREYGILKRAPSERPLTPFMIKLEEGTTNVPDAGFHFEMTSVPHTAAVKQSNKFEALFDAAEAADELVVRNFREGDRIAPIGITGHRKVKDIFIDQKLPARERRRFPILQLKGAIAWLPGIVRGRVGLVTERTERVLHVRASSAATFNH
jgi:tRNA(Ile)-lysidine synthase